MKIYSPSYKRASTVLTHKILPEVIYCVHEFEAKAYQDLGYNIEVLPDSIRGNIAKVRNYIKKNLIKNKGMMIDDDIKSIKCWGLNDDLKPRAKRVDCLAEFFEYCFSMCEQFGCTMWGLNIVVNDKGSYREYTPFSLSSWFSGSLQGFMDHDLDFDERIPLKEDLDICLQTLNKYRKILRFNFAFMEKDDHRNIGGCADIRTIVKEKEQFYLFQKKWGKKIVKVDTKNSQTVSTYFRKQRTGFDFNPVLSVPIKGV